MEGLDTRICNDLGFDTYACRVEKAYTLPRNSLQDHTGNFRKSNSQGLSGHMSANLFDDDI